jgi:hypothetical protein
VVSPRIWPKDFLGMARVERSILVEASAEVATSQINAIAIMQNLN